MHHITKSDWTGDKNIEFYRIVYITSTSSTTLRTPAGDDDSEEEMGEELEEDGDYEGTHYSASPLDLGYSGPHVESLDASSPISQLTREFQAFRIEMQNEFHDFLQDVYNYLNDIHGDVRTLLRYY